MGNRPDARSPAPQVDIILIFRGIHAPENQDDIHLTGTAPFDNAPARRDNETKTQAVGRESIFDH
ncbi:MAG: hypothetical protein H8F28_14270 [Fibrella sp.]|nr:hypothetical protein [Armatimonadota bacterium]